MLDFFMSARRLKFYFALVKFNNRSAFILCWLCCVATSTSPTTVASICLSLDMFSDYSTIVSKLREVGTAIVSSCLSSCFCCWSLNKGKGLTHAAFVNIRLLRTTSWFWSGRWSADRSVVMLSFVLVSTMSLELIGLEAATFRFVISVIFDI
jgi:hypothetical protein